MYDVVVCLPRQQALSQRYVSVAKQDMVFVPDLKLAQDGYVQRHTSQSTSMEAIRRQFINFAKQDEANYSQFVAISRLGECEMKHFYYFFIIMIFFFRSSKSILQVPVTNLYKLVPPQQTHAGNGKPQLLRLTAFNQLCEILSDRLVSPSGEKRTLPKF